MVKRKGSVLDKNGAQHLKQHRRQPDNEVNESPTIKLEPKEDNRDENKSVCGSEYILPEFVDCADSDIGDEHADDIKSDNPDSNEPLDQDNGESAEHDNGDPIEDDNGEPADNEDDASCVPVNASTSCSGVVTKQETDSDSDIEELLLCLHRKLKEQLSRYWIPFVDDGGVHVLLLARLRPKMVQRDLFFNAREEVTLHVHGEPVDIKPFLTGVPAFEKLSAASMDVFAERSLKIISKVRLMEVCIGANYTEYRTLWKGFPYGAIDKNMFREKRYFETMRSHTCKRLVQLRQKRCKDCGSLKELLKKLYIASSV